LINRGDELERSQVLAAGDLGGLGSHSLGKGDRSGPAVAIRGEVLAESDDAAGG
jgi:hypothetical protein